MTRCALFVCETSKRDGVICADDSCDIETGVREPLSPHPLKIAMDEIATRERFGTLYDEIFENADRNAGAS